MDYSWNHDYPQIARHSGFKLRQIKEGELDWRLLGTVDIDSLVRNQNLERLDALLGHVADAPLAKILDSNVLDGGVVKYFHLAQLSIQYLLFCKRFLDETLAGVRGTLHTLRAENIGLKELNQESNDELLKLHKKLQKIEDINQIVYPCSMCPKNFISNEMLDTHIKRKHCKNSHSGKASVENDTNLINTIKLELEIKHLKERLNVAEREIREKPDNSRLESIKCHETKPSSGTDTKASVEHSTCSVGTQIAIHTINIGIQNNLEEAKELDEADSAHKEDPQQNVINELREKLSLFEDWKRQEALENERSVDVIRRQVSEMLASVDLKLDQIQNTEKATNDHAPTISSADITEMQKTFSENLLKICKESEAKLSTAITTFELGYKNKLEDLETLIKRYDNSLKVVKESVRTSDANVAVAPAMRQMRKVRAKHLESQIKQDLLHRNPILLISEGETAESSSEEATVFETRPGTVKSDRPRTENKENILTMESSPQRHSRNKSTLYQTALKLFQKRLRIFGIDSNTKALSKRAREEISERLIERRNSLRKNYPNYFVTRNKLKQTVEKLAKERIESRIEKSEQPSSTLVVAEKPKSPDTTGRNHGALAEVHYVQPSASDSEESQKDFRQANTMPQSYNSPTQQHKTRDEFKARLEKILASPIRKPIVQVRTFTSEQIAATDKPPASLQTESSLKKPIPTPRKKVMFDINSSSDDNENVKQLGLEAHRRDVEENSGSSSDIGDKEVKRNF